MIRSRRDMRLLGGHITNLNKTRGKKKTGKNAGGRHTPGDGIITPEHIEYDNGKPIPIRQSLPRKGYIPKDPGRAARLLQANADINADRTKAGKNTATSDKRKVGKARHE